MREQSSTYFAQQNNEELRRLALLDQMITAAMGGVLSEQPDPTVFHSVLYIACGSGGWVIEAARQYPSMHLVGIDISNRMIEYAHRQAPGNSRVEFQMMDALRPLAFPAASFDLVNLRFLTSLQNGNWSLFGGKVSP
jgi:SAM-dependent methyltransferase